jgi:phospholipid/cholesterol/gamma-HCH transport system substrate-binding protein
VKFTNTQKLKISREIKTALLAITALVLLYVGISYLMSKSVFAGGRVFYAEYNDVGGLVPATKVMINGYQVGKVQDIQLQPSGKSVVTMALDHDFQFSKNSTVQLQENGFIGGKTLAILLTQDNSPLAVSGDTLKTSVSPGMIDDIKSQLTPLQTKVEGMVVSADSLMTSLNAILDKESRNSIKNSLKELNTTIANFKNASATFKTILDENKEKLGNSMASMETITENFAKVSDSLSKVEFNKTVNQLQSTIKSLDNIVAGMKNGDGSIGKLLKDKELYENLTGMTFQLEQLFQDMKLNPKRYVHFSLFGKKPKPYKPPTEEEEKKN